MIKNKKISVLFLLGILIVLVIAYAGLRAWNKSQEEKEKEQAEKEKIYVTDLEDMSGISFDVGNGQMELVKEGGTWYNAQDKDFPVDQSYPEYMVSVYAKLEVTRKLEDGDDLEDYGLKDPMYTIVLTDSDGTQTDVYIGNVTGEDYYMTLNDKSEVYTVSSDTISQLQYTWDDIAKLDDWPAIGSGNMKKAVITKGDESVTYQSDDDDSEEILGTIAGGLGAVTLSETADYSVEDADLAQYGLEEGTRTTIQITYTKSDGSSGEDYDEDDEAGEDTEEEEPEEKLTLYFGKEDGSGNRYMRIGGSDIVYKISTSICNNILYENQDQSDE